MKTSLLKSRMKVSAATNWSSSKDGPTDLFGACDVTSASNEKGGKESRDD